MANRSIRALIFALVILAMSASAFAQIGISVSFGPPPLPVYEQPPCPEEGYIWTPGYWAYDNDYDDYYWVPGTWVMAPEPDLFWTPAYWAWSDGGFRFYDGYWGPQVGFYGGINYGYGYFGDGYEGGRWDHGHFFYNRSVNNVNVTVIHNVYNTTVINRTVNRVSFNGGNGGVSARPTPQQEAVARERHVAPVAAQTQHIRDARQDRQLRASENHGKPPVAATAKPGAFRDHAVAAREAGGPYTPPANRQPARRDNAPAPNAGNAERNNNNNNNNGGNRANVFHPKDIPPRDRPAPPNTGDPNRDRKYQQQQEKLNTRQDQERQKLQQRQEQDHQKIAKQNSDEARKRQVEQRHQQQTQQMSQRQDQQRQKLEQKQQPRQNKPQPQPQKEQHPPQ